MFTYAITKKVELGALKSLLRSRLGQKLLQVQLFEEIKPLKWLSHRRTLFDSRCGNVIRVAESLDLDSAPIFHTGLATECRVKN